MLRARGESAGEILENLAAGACGEVAELGAFAASGCGYQVFGGDDAGLGELPGFDGRTRARLPGGAGREFEGGIGERRCSLCAGSADQQDRGEEAGGRMVGCHGVKGV